MKRHFEKGSALFIILIGVILFAALAYSVSQMMRGGNPDTISNEKTKLAGTEITAYARSLRQGAQNIKISNGCSDLDISFENDLITGYEHTPSTSDNCKIFNNKGGGLVYEAPQEEWLDSGVSTSAPLRGTWYFPANVCVPDTGTAETGCASDGQDNEALIAVLPYIKKNLCKTLNDLLGVTNPGGNPPVETGDAWTAARLKYTGTQSDGVSLDQAGHMAGCFEGNGTPGAQTYSFYQILIPR